MLSTIFNFKNYDWKKYNIALIIVVIILGVISATVLKLAGGDDMGSYYFSRQLMGLAAGVVIAVGVSLIDYHFVCRFTPVYYAVGTILVAATRFSPFGVDHGTTQYRWLKIGIEFQPSELCKIILVLTLATLFLRLRDRINKWYVIPCVCAVAALPTFFVMIQSDLSSSLVMMFILAILIFSSGITYKILLPIVAVMIPVVLGLFWYIQQPYQKLLSPYQLERVIGFLNPEEHSLDIMYQQLMSVDAIASGKVTGKVFSGAGGRNYRSVDVNESDFIFSVIGEEFGFVGSFLIIALLAAVVIMCVVTAVRACDYLGQMIGMGIAAMLMFQLFANIGVATMILPNTGLPLPFLSYGLTSMVSCMIGIGFVVNVGLQSGSKRQDGFSMIESDS